ncbi:MAG: flavodoxin domain-containing protein [Fibrobacterota bacterium]|nr:flavodoxin domain-containing protein [Chitinispirillaceae bacterium]
MSKKVLILFASRSGSTADTATIIANELQLKQKDITIDVLPVKKPNNIASYDLIILGSAIWMGKPLPEMLSFIKSYLPILKTKKIICFALCMNLRTETDKTIQESAAFLAPFSVCAPIETKIFAGSVDYSKLGFFARLIVKMVKSPQGDFRKIDIIKTWAAGIASKHC